jgi:hypothetical protein
LYGPPQRDRRRIASPASGETPHPEFQLFTKQEAIMSSEMDKAAR